MNYFTISELVASSTAKQKKIDNTPSEEVVEHLQELIETLNSLREYWGGPIRVTSGYRCPELNRAVGGVKNSAHLTGYAADLQPVNGDMKRFKEKCLQWSQNAKFDQLIIERSGRTEWVHLGLYNSKGEQRHQVFKINK